MHCTQKTLPGFLGLKDVKWNFTKFLINKQVWYLAKGGPHRSRPCPNNLTPSMASMPQGVPVKRFGPQEEPNSMVKDIEKLL
jgi:glutathione peroxidase-family protein